jgi:flagellar biosynthesis protein FliR
MPVTPEYLVSVVLIFVRIGGILMAAPFFSQRFIPVRVKIFFSLILAFAISGLVSSPLPPNAMTTLGLMIAVGIEAVTGLLLGFAGQFVFWAVQMAGEVIGFQVGLSMAQAFDPATESSANPIGRFLGFVFTLVFLLLDGHHHILRATVASFDAVPLAGAQLMAGGPVLISWTGKFLANAIRLAAPFMITILLVDTALGLFARMVPQADLFSVGLPLKVFMGLLLSYLFMQYFFPVVPAMVDLMVSDMMQLIEVLAP